MKAPHEPVVAYANAFFFTNPAATLKDQLKRAAAARPSMVVALDSLFWFCYGEGLSEAARLERFETGLRMLEAIPVPLHRRRHPRRNWRRGRDSFEGGDARTHSSRSATNVSRSGRERGRT